MSVALWFLTGVFLWEGMNTEPIKKALSKHKKSIKILVIIPLAIIETSKNFARKFVLFYKNKPALIFSSILLLHAIGLLYTADFDHAFNDLRIKLPLFLLPLFLSTTAGLGKKAFSRLLGLYVAAVLAATLISLYIYLSRETINTREISIYISHIRFSLNVCLAIFILWFFVNKKYEFKPAWRVGFAMIMLWLVLFLFILKSMTGVLAFLVTAAIVIIWYLFKQQNLIKRYVILFITILIPILIVGYIIHTSRNYMKVEKIDISVLDKYTPRGNLYYHDTAMGIEEGKHLGIFVCYPELRESWNARSDFDFDGNDKIGQELKYTLIRYLTSKDYRKDADGVDQLTLQDMENIENGIANVNYLKKFNPQNTIHQFLLAYLDYKRYGNIAGYSAFERLEQLKASTSIIRNNFWTGVGTGDIRLAFKEELTKMDSDLKDTHEHGMYSSHNQFLNIGVLFGIFGLVWFIFALIYPPIKLRMFSDYLFLTFFVIMIVSMLTDDTLNTQPGSTFLCFFYSLFLFGRGKDTKTARVEPD